MVDDLVFVLVRRLGEGILFLFFVMFVVELIFWCDRLNFMNFIFKLREFFFFDIGCEG